MCAYTPRGTHTGAATAGAPRLRIIPLYVNRPLGQSIGSSDTSFPFCLGACCPVSARMPHEELVKGAVLWPFFYSPAVARCTYERC